VTPYLLKEMANLDPLFKVVAHPKNELISRLDRARKILLSL
jgi:hypothetical protein